jgi:thioredoxin-dependent peroxiredoxin
MSLLNYDVNGLLSELNINEMHYPVEGDVAPDFTFKAANGKSMNLSDYRGSRCVILYFYPKDFTPGCTTEAKEFSMYYDKFEKQGIIILGVSPDNADSHTEFKERMRIPYELVSDTGNKIASLYGCYGLKNYMGKEYMGIYRSTFLISKDGKIIRVFHRVKPLGHGEQVLNSFANFC